MTPRDFFILFLAVLSIYVQARPIPPAEGGGPHPPGPQIPPQNVDASPLDASNSKNHRPPNTWEQYKSKHGYISPHPYRRARTWKQYKLLYGDAVLRYGVPQQSDDHIPPHPYRRARTWKEYKLLHGDAVLQYGVPQQSDDHIPPEGHSPPSGPIRPDLANGLPVPRPPRPALTRNENKDQLGDNAPPYLSREWISSNNVEPTLNPGPSKSPTHDLPAHGVPKQSGTDNLPVTNHLPLSQVANDQLPYEANQQSGSHIGKLPATNPFASEGGSLPASERRSPPPLRISGVKSHGPNRLAPGRSAQDQPPSDPSFRLTQYEAQLGHHVLPDPPQRSGSYISPATYGFAPSQVEPEKRFYTASYNNPTSGDPILTPLLSSTQGRSYSPQISELQSVSPDKGVSLPSTGSPQSTAFKPPVVTSVTSDGNSWPQILSEQGGPSPNPRISQWLSMEDWVSQLLPESSQKPPQSIAQPTINGLSKYNNV